MVSETPDDEENKGGAEIHRGTGALSGGRGEVAKVVKYPFVSGASVMEMLHQTPVELLPEKSTYSVQELETIWPGQSIVVCDFWVENIHQGTEIRGEKGTPCGYAQGKVINIDHHAPVDGMSRQISSAPLAIEYVQKHGHVPQDVPVVIHHTDCDSVLSSAIMRGILPPDQRFCDAAIATDHTGAENGIGDLLQALEKERDLVFSFSNLQKLLMGRPVDERAATMLRERQEDRQRATAIVQQGGFHRIGDVAYTSVDKKFDAGFLPALLPDAMVIVMGSPLEEGSNLWAIKVRLGQKAPAGLRLNGLHLDKFGGRWNAGNTKRAGGCTHNPEEYARMVDVKIKEWLGAHA